MVAQCVSSALQAIVDHMQIGLILVPKFEPGVDMVALRLRHYGDVYILAQNLRMEILEISALREWLTTANTCFFGALSITALKSLVQHICLNTSRYDFGIRLAALDLLHLHFRGIETWLMQSQRIRRCKENAVQTFTRNCSITNVGSPN